MRAFIFFFFGLILFSCGKTQTETDTTRSRKIISACVNQDELQELLQSAGIDGVILVYDANKKTYYSSDCEAVKIGHLPASTFKIPNSIVGLELGLTDTARIFPWNGEQHYLDVWEQDLTLKQAFQYSCVPCYQQLAREIGVERMLEKLSTLGYPEMDVTDTTIDNFWLTGSSRITPKQQVDFLRRLHEKELPITEKTVSSIHDIMLREKTDSANLYGKTGMSITNDIANGWFVGFATTQENTIYFAVNITQNDTMPRNEFQPLRIQLAVDALAEMGVAFN